MAKRSFNQKARALQPAVMKLNFIAGENSGNQVVDISACVSRLNRRFYRQGLNWAVGNVSVTTLPAVVASAGSEAYVNTIPHTWSAANSWVKAFHAWRDQQDAAIDEMGAESAVAAFRDFKISMEGHTPTLLNPVGVGTQGVPGPLPTGLLAQTDLLAAEEWSMSQIVIPNDGAPGVTTEYYLHMVGPSVATSKGLIAGYEFSRAYPQSPDPTTPSIETSWLNQMHDVGDNSDEIVQNAQDRNNELPYHQSQYPGGKTNFINLECQGYTLNQSTIGRNTFNTGPFTAPCGLIRFDFRGQAAVAGSNPYNFITITLVPGAHRGYLAETMEEF